MIKYALIAFPFFLIISSLLSYSNGSWRSVWNLEFSDDHQKVELMGNIQVLTSIFQKNYKLLVKIIDANSMVGLAGWCSLF